MSDDKRINITLIRHGATQSNDSGRYIGRRTDEELSGEAFMYSYDEDKPDKVFSGPLKRCAMSARLLFPETTPVIIEEMTEIDFGEFEGKSYDELKHDERYQSWIDSGGRLPFPGGEDRDSFIKKSFTAFRELLSRMADNESAVLICHGGNIMAVMSTLLGGDYYDYMIGNFEGYRLSLLVSDEDITVLSHDSVCVKRGA